MEKNIRSASIALMSMGLMAACSPNVEQQAEKTVVGTPQNSQSAPCEELTDSIVKKLFWSLPTFAEEESDMERSEEASASDAAALIKEAKDLVTIETPLRTAYYASSIFGEICDREKTSIDSVRICTSGDSTLAIVYVRYCYVGYSGSREYSYLATTLNLVQSGGTWLIDDFAIGNGHFKSEMADFIRRQRLCFASQEWRTWFIKERFEGRYPRYKEKDRPTSKRMLQSIMEYMKSYPDSSSVVGDLGPKLRIESSAAVQKKLLASGLSVERIAMLFNAIPGATSRDNSCNLPDPKKAYSKQLSALISHALEIPNDAFGNEGSDYALNLLVNDVEDDLVFVNSSTVVPVSEDVVSVFLNVAHVKGFDVRLKEHNVLLVRENNQWLLADFGRSQFLMEYIARQRRYFRSTDWQLKVEHERKSAQAEEDPNLRKQWMAAIDKNLNEVEAYFAKYPDK